MGLVRNQATGDPLRRGAGRGADETGGRSTLRGARTWPRPIVGISGFPGRYPGWAQFRALGAASLECCAVAEGVLDAYTVVGRSTLYGWDYLAGLLVCREAGAAEAERDGTDLVVRDAIEPAAARGGDAPPRRQLLNEETSCERRRRPRCGHARHGGPWSRCTA